MDGLRRLFEAESQNDLDKFYANLNTQIQQFNSSQTLDADKYNSTMEDSRERFYKEMQYNIDLANAKWRQEVETREDAQAHEAAATDVKNAFDIKTSMLNQIWDRSDALLDYAWKTSESAKDRQHAMALAVLQGQIQSDLEEQKAWGSLAGLVVGDILNLSGRSSGSTILNLFGL